jgi:hypothetical protein
VQLEVRERTSNGTSGIDSAAHEPHITVQHER